MKKLLKILGFAVIALVVVLGGAVAFLALKPPKMRPASIEKVEATPARLARGRYITLHVADCLTCHSEVDGTRFGIPAKPGTEGKGGFPFTKALGIPGVVCAQNITSDKETGLGNWTDGEIIRAIREGIDRNGQALFPMMQYQSFREMSDEDVKSVVVYVRTLPPVRNQVPLKKIDFPVNLFVKAAPRPVEGVLMTPNPQTDPFGYGSYLVTISSCRECHTPHDEKGQRIPSGDFSGGWEMRGPWGRVVTANITPHKDTYMGKATREEFIGRFKSFESLQGENSPIAPKGQNTVMPWLPLSGMTTEDLGLIYDYLKTIPPIEHKIVTFPDAPKPAG